MLTQVDTTEGGFLFLVIGGLAFLATAKCTWVHPFFLCRVAWIAALFWIAFCWLFAVLCLRWLLIWIVVELRLKVGQAVYHTGAKSVW